MRVYYNQSREKSVVMTLGTFDGVHLGHQKIIKLAVKRARDLNCDSALFTFRPHPLQVIASKNAPQLLTTWQQTRRLIQSLGINRIILKKFTKEFAQISARRFVEDYLVNRFRVKEIIVGEDFRCGYQGEGTPDRLAKLGKEFGFEVRVIPAVKINTQEAGSTSIRSLIKEGKIKKASEQLGRNFIIDCKVISGDKRGRELGFPTANLRPVINYVLPSAGVYVCRAIIEDKVYNGVVNLGLRPTFNKEDFSIEVHIFDFMREIYGTRLQLEFIEKIRVEEKFVSSQQLIARIKKDIKIAQEVFDLME